MSLSQKWISWRFSQRFSLHALCGSFSIFSLFTFRLLGIFSYTEKKLFFKVDLLFDLLPFFSSSSCFEP
jgi:hypothetical protein